MDSFILGMIIGALAYGSAAYLGTKLAERSIRRERAKKNDP
jgi:hypothetical protein